ncbi:Alpha-amylase [Cytospora mali]|uniref:Alpha-amylase n=1 Tax=Cytospora mali TaxID=578113 RepID=A0A194VSE6_CYTMA|nr:Alpha-amylase [Valsa mali]
MGEPTIPPTSHCTGMAMDGQQESCQDLGIQCKPMAHPPKKPNAAGENPTMFQGFEWYTPADHKHWNRLEGALPSLASLGITSVWIPPACKASWYTGNGYDVYDIYDLGEFDQKGARHTKWGTKEELVAMAERAEQCGVTILFDAVLNHKAAADYSEEVVAVQVDPKNREEVVGEPHAIEAWTGYDFPGRGTTYSPLRWNKNHFTGIDYDHKTKKNAVWKFQGKEWAQDVDEELGNYDYLMFADIDHSDPEVRQDLFNWVQWLASQVRLGGFRLDAIKHYSASFLKELIAHIDRTVGRDWFIVGEYWREEQSVLSKFINFMDGRISLFDVRLVNNFSRLSFQDNADLRTVFDGSLVATMPNNAVTLVANHDTMEGQSLEAPVAEYFLPIAYSLILLRADCGIPCVFYGNLYGYPRPDGHGFVEPPFGGEIIPKIVLARKLYAYGRQLDYFDDPHCIGFTRLGGLTNGYPTAVGSGLAVLMTNGWTYTTKKMFVGPEHAGERWTDLLHVCCGEVVIDRDGWGDFAVAPRSAAIWVNKQDGRRHEIDNYVFDHDIYKRERNNKPVTADDLHHPRLKTEPVWMTAMEL